MLKHGTSSTIVGLIAGSGITAAAALLMGQGAQPPTTTPPSGTQPQQTTYPQNRSGEYFVTGDGSSAHLWVREGMSLRHVADADTTRTPGRTPGDKPADWKDHDKDVKPTSPK
jgi:hypothetical protein